MERQRRAQARHLALLASDAPVMNRCSKEEAHLKQRLAQSTAAITRSARQNQAAAEREERARETHLQAQFAAILSKTPEIQVPGLTTSHELTAAADADSSRGDAAQQRGAAVLHRPVATAAAPSTTFDSAAVIAAPSSSPPACLLGFPEPYATSGFKSIVQWASVALDETFLTAYGPRRLREETQTSTVDAASARDALPHRLMAAVACYVLNEVLCADATLSSLWQDKLRQPVFDAVFSSQTIASGQEKRKAYQGHGAAGNEAARSHVIVQRTLGAAASSSDAEENNLAITPFPAATADGAAPAEPPFPPRTNCYVTRDDFAVMRLWTEEVTAEQREKVLVCRRVRSLQQLMERRMQLLQVYQRQTNVAMLRSIFTAWRTHTRQSRAHRAAVERYLVNRHSRVLEENVFLRWRRVTLQTKVESLQRRMLNIVAEREEAARQHTVDLAAVQEQLSSERHHHQQASYEQQALQTQILESHSMEVEALRLVLSQQRAQTAEVGRWARRWERLAKTFRPARLCPAVPPAMWSLTEALYDSEEAVVTMVLGKGGDRRVLQQMPYSVILPVRERLERLLLAWVNSVMEKSPLASSWVPLKSFIHGRSAHPRSILVSQKAEADPSSPSRNAAADSCLTEFGVFTLMTFIRELRRLYILAGKMTDLDGTDSRLPRSAGNGTFGGGGISLAKCFRDVVQLLSVQTSGGLYPSLLTHCASLSRWFNPDGIFGGPVKSFEGAGRERRLQHRMFVWLLTTLLVGHIRMAVLAPAGEKDDGLPPPASAAVSLRSSREAEMEKIPHINFPVEAVAAASAPSPRETDTKGAKNPFSRGTTVVAQNTLLPKKTQNAPSSAASTKSSGVARDGTATFASGSPHRALGAVAQADDPAALLRSTVTLETALLERSQRPGAALTDAEDSLSDIEAYLGLLTTQSRSLRTQDSQRSRAATTVAGQKGAAADNTVNNTANGNSRGGDGDDDDLVKGLLQQLVEARDAAAQSRRVRRLRRQAANNDAGTKEDTEEPLSPFLNGADSDGEGDGEDSNGDTQNSATCRLEGRTAAVLTEGQLRILRSLPARSCAFDALRPIPAVAKASSSPTEAGNKVQDDAPPAGGPSGKFYSFLLNTLEDVTRRQQWAGLARVVTSLVVRFRILDDVEDGAWCSDVLPASREEAQKKETATAVSSPSSSSAAAVAQSARLPAIPPTAAAAAGQAAPQEAKKANAAEGSSSARGRSCGPRTPAPLMPSRLPQSSRDAVPMPCSATVSRPHTKKGTEAQLLTSHETHALKGEMREGGLSSSYAAPSAATPPQKPVTKAQSETKRNTAANAAPSPSSSPQPHVKQQKKPQRHRVTTSSPNALTLPRDALDLGISSPSTLIEKPKENTGEDKAETEAARRTDSGEASAGSESAADLSIVATSREVGLELAPEKAASPPPSATLQDRKAAVQPPSMVSHNSPPPFNTATSPPTPTLPPAKPTELTEPRSQQHVPALPVSQPHGAGRVPATPSGPPTLTLAPTAPRKEGPYVAAGLGGEASEEGGAPQDGLGYLDPLVEHGRSQSSATAVENIRKFRFHIQP